MTILAGLMADPGSLVLFVAAIIGGLIRAAAGTHPTLSRRTILDILASGLLGVVFPLLGIVSTEGATLLQRAALGLLVGLFGSYLLAFVAYRLGIFKEDVRATKPDKGRRGNA